MQSERTAIIVHDSVPLEKILDIARRADEKGCWGVFMTEEAGHDTQVALGALAGVTKRARLGAGISSIYTRSPTIYAMSANTLNTLSNGRAVVGLGTSPPFFVKHWHGTEFDKPVARMRDYLRIIRAVLEGKEKLRYQGKAISADDFIFSIDPPKNRIPLWVGAIGPQMVQVAGEVGDGVLLSPLLTEEYLQSSVEQVKKGAAKAGRDWREVEIAAPIITAVDPDERQALEWGRSMVTYFSVVYYFRPLFEVSGLVELHEKINRTNKEKGYMAARDVIPEEVVRRLMVVGTPDQCRQRLRELRAAGLTLPVLNAPGPRRIYNQPVRVPVPEYDLNYAIVEHLP